LSQTTVNRLQARARTHGRSLQQEVRDILERAATTLTMNEARRLPETWHRHLAGRSFSDSARLIREDRERR
jgi:hypothetical protein